MVTEKLAERVSVQRIGDVLTLLTFQKINFLKYKHTVYQHIEFAES